MGYWIVGLAVALIAFLCIRSIVRDLRSGKCVGCSLGGCAKCGGSCGSCGGSCASGKGADTTKKTPEAGRNNKSAAAKS